MLLQRENHAALNTFFQAIHLHAGTNEPGKNKAAKIEQILAYLEVMHAQLRKYSRKRELVFIESGAGNCYLSFLVYYFYTHIDRRPVTVHCVDINERLMNKAQKLAQELQLDNMFFHACDISDYTHSGRVDAVYSLHACDSATDKALYLGLKTQARHILSVSCCQHSIKKHLKGHPYKGITRHRVFKDRIVYMIGDSLRALLLEMHGYNVDILEFVSSRHTDKNIMLRAHKDQIYNLDGLKNEYEKLRNTFHVKPFLENYLEHGV